jgi:transcriptional regulator with XRE-family HTH domain
MSKKELEELMELRGWTQADFSRELDMSEASVSRWLDGKRQPTKGTLKLLRQWLEQAREEAKTQPA